MANSVKSVGKVISYIGMFAVFLMAIIGTISVDIVIISFLSKESRKNHNLGFATGWFFGMMWSNSNSFYNDLGYRLLASPFLTSVAVVLSIFLGVPEVGLLLIAGWAGAAGIVALGMAVHKLGEWLEGVTTPAHNRLAPLQHNVRFGPQREASNVVAPAYSPAYPPADPPADPPAYSPAYSPAYRQENYGSIFSRPSSPSAPPQLTNHLLP